MAQGKNSKHFVSEIIELSNGDQIWAKNLPIKKLKIFHKEMQRWTDYLEETREEVKELEVKAAEMTEDSPKDYDETLEKLQREYEKAHRDDLSFMDVAASCALIALGCWTVRSEKGQTIENDKIDLEYVEDNIDMISLNRILEIAGAMSVGDVSEQGKANG